MLAPEKETTSGSVRRCYQLNALTLPSTTAAELTSRSALQHFGQQTPFCHVPL